MRRPSTNLATSFLLVAGVGVLAYAALKPPAGYHPVTETMTASAGAMAGARVTDRAAEGTDGRTHAPASEAEGRPLVLFFIQDGCPCSEAADPYFRRLQAAYGPHASFLGVIDGDLATARDWAERHGSPFPILADPGREIIAASRAERSAYVMLVSPGGTIESLWPGYSSKMLEELGIRLARLAGRPEVALDTRGAPTDLVSGCAF